MASGNGQGFVLPPRLHLDQTDTSAGSCSAKASSGSPCTKKGQPWTEAEHLAFLAGLQKFGRGNWRGIAKHYVQTRTATQVASHAQKHFLRVNGVTKRKSRFSILEQAACAQGLLSQNSAGLASASAPLTLAWVSSCPSMMAYVAPPASVGCPSAPCPTAEVGQTHWPQQEHQQQQQSLSAGSSTLCRPTAYHASDGHLEKLQQSIAPSQSASEQGLSPRTLQPSTHSAFRSLSNRTSIKV